MCLLGCDLEQRDARKDDDDDDDEFRFNDASTHESHLRQNGVLTWFCNETAKTMSYIHENVRLELHAQMKFTAALDISSSPENC